MLITPDKIREIVGLSVDEAPDTEIEPHIERAQRELLYDIAIRVEEDVLSGSINGTNKTFEVTYYPIADSNFDGQIDKHDITIYAWKEEDKPNTKIEFTASTVYPEYGIIVLNTAPGTQYVQLTADYFYYPREIDMELMKEACAYLAGYYYILREYCLIPEQLYHGALRLRYVKPYMVLLDEYYRIRDILLSMPYAKGEHEEPEQIREELG